MHLCDSSIQQQPRPRDVKAGREGVGKRQTDRDRERQRGRERQREGTRKKRRHQRRKRQYLGGNLCFSVVFKQCWHLNNENPRTLPNPGNDDSCGVPPSNVQHGSTCQWHPPLEARGLDGATGREKQPFSGFADAVGAKPWKLLVAIFASTWRGPAQEWNQLPGQQGWEKGKAPWRGLAPCAHPCLRPRLHLGY